MLISDIGFFYIANNSLPQLRNGLLLLATTITAIVITTGATK